MSGWVAVNASATLAVKAGGAGEWAAADIDALRGTTPSPFASGAYFGIDTSDGNFTYGASSRTAWTPGLTKWAPLLTLTASNSFSGGTTIQAGTLAASNANALSTSGTITVNGNATFAVAAGVTFTRPVTFNAGSALAGQGTFTTNGWTCPTNITLAPGLPAGTLTVDVGGSSKALKLSTNDVLRIAFQPDGTHGTLSVNGAMDISEPTARLVLTGKPPQGRSVLAQGTSRVGQFQPANVGMTGLQAAEAHLIYRANQVILTVSRGAVVVIR